MSSKREILLKSFCEMNTDMLELLLEDSRPYNDVSKETILKKLDELFAEFKKAKDTELIAYPGKCASEDCTNKGCKGFSFVGNQSKKHIDLIVEEKENDWAFRNIIFSQPLRIIRSGVNIFSIFDFRH